MRLLPLLFAVFALAGCREALLTGPDPVVDPDPVEPGSAFARIYVKFSGPLREGTVGQVRAEYTPGVTHYQWAFEGPGDVSTTPADPEGRDRVLSVVGVAAGDILATATAYDAAGNVLGVGSRAVEVTE